MQFPPSNNPFARTGSRRQLRHDDWDASSEEDEGDLELRPTYTLSQPSGPGPYDRAHNPFDEQETSYKDPVPVHPTGAPVEHLDGDLGTSSSVPPQVPRHGQQPSSGVQLYDGPPR
jgi:hypothetical protein